jgi:hypothetical protein
MQFEILIVYFALTLPVYQEELLGVNEGLDFLQPIHHRRESAPRANGVMTIFCVNIMAEQHSRTHSAVRGFCPRTAFVPEDVLSCQKRN